MLKQKSADQMCYRKDGRSMKSLTDDEIEYLKSNLDLYAWKTLKEHINSHRPKHLSITIGYLRLQSIRMGVYKKVYAAVGRPKSSEAKVFKKEETHVSDRPQVKTEGRFVDYREFDWYYKSK